MINFINESKRIIRKASENKKLVIFVGAGISANSGYPSWGSLVEEFANGLGMDTKNISQEDYLKIPQYYYNSRKEKEYYDVIFNKFKVQVKPNPIHDLIFDLNPYHVVTTNYDELLEEAARNKGIFYDVVSKDKDLPYTPNNNMIIKMHGELKNKNIVLKEDDYLSYFKNFKLIQNYIKSLISTYTILFIGYSVSDINVKYIFQWVKDILGNDFQQAYFLDVDERKKFDQIEFEYYKNRGVNILYYSQIKDVDFFERDIDCKGLTHNKGKNIYKFLKYLLDDGNKHMLNVNYAYDRLKSLNNLKQIRFKDIKRALNLETPYQDGRYIYYSHFRINGEEVELVTNIVKELFIEIEKFQDKLTQIKECTDGTKKKELKREIDFSKKLKIDLIKKVFYKSGLRKIVEQNEKYEKTILLELDIEEEEDYLEKYSLMCDYYNLDKYINGIELNEIDGKEEEYLDKVYGLYKIGKQIEAYEMLKGISESCFKNKKYYLYFISEFNRYHLGHGISTVNIFATVSRGISNDMQNSIRKEKNNIDLDNIYLKLPSSNRPSLFFLREILNFNFIYSKIKDTIELKEKVEKDKNVIHINISKNKGQIYKFRKDIKEFWRFLTKNRLMLDKYIEVKRVFYSYVEGAFLSHMIDDSEEKETILGWKGKILKLEKIDYFTFFIMLSYLTKEDIEYLFKKYDVEILEIEENNLKDIEKVYDNIVESIMREKNILESKEIVKRFLYLLSRIDIQKELFIKILDRFLQIIDYWNQNELREIYDNLLSFLVKQNNNFKDNVCTKKLEKFLNYILSKIILSSGNNFYKENYIFKFVRKIVIIIKNIDGDYILENYNKVRLLIKQMDIEFNPNIVSDILVPLNNLLMEEVADDIVKLIYKTLNNTNGFDYNLFILYYDAVISKVILSNMTLEEKVMLHIDEILKLPEEIRKTGLNSFENNKEDFLAKIAFLIINDLIEVPNKFSKYRKDSEIFSFLTNMNDYDYDNFKLEWILISNDKLHKKLSESEKAREFIKEQIKNRILEGKCEKNIIDIFFKYYD